MNITNCGWTHGQSFAVAYLFTPNGVRAFCGGMVNVRKSTSLLPTCHGIIHWYNKGETREYFDYFQKIKITLSSSGKTLSSLNKAESKINEWGRGVVRKSWRIFGRNACNFHLDSTKNSCDKTVRGQRGSWIILYNPYYRPYDETDFMCRNTTGTRELGRFRKLPSKYMSRVFADKG